MRQENFSIDPKAVSQRLHERLEEVTQQNRKLRELLGYSNRSEQQRLQRYSRVLQEHIQQQLFAARMRLSCLRRDGDPELREMVQEVDSILLDTLEATRALSMDLSPTVVHEGGLIAGLERLAEHLKLGHDFTVQLDIDSRAEPSAMDARLLLFDCAHELLLNAVKHAGVSEAKLVLAKTDDGKIKMVVSDAGRGFDATILEQHGAGAITFGLLSMSERLAQYGGRLQVETSAGRGARFTLLVPADMCTVLICDDHAIVRAGYIRLLQSEPGIHVVAQAVDGKRAIELAGELSPDVVIMDVTLPDMDGSTATRCIMEANPHIQVIGLSMHDEEHIKQAMLDAGAVQYMLKTDSHENLIAAVKACRQRLNQNAGHVSDRLDPSQARGDSVE